MIKFFRRIRQNLINTLPAGRFSKYFLYAIGEIVLVVIGILIALQINNWNEYRKERAEEQKILKQLKKEYTQNLRQLDEKIDMRNKMSAASDLLLSYLDEPRPIEADSLLYCIFRLSQDPTFDPIQNDIMTSGKLRLIENDSIAEMLSNWTSDAYQVQEIEKGWQQIRVRNYDPVLLKSRLIRNMTANILNSGYSPNHALDKQDTIRYHITKNDIDIPQTVLDYRTELESMASACILFNNITNIQAFALRKRIIRLLALIEMELDENV